MVPLPPPKPVNKQLYENSELAGSEIEREAIESPDALFNRKLPNLAIAHEKSEHRAIILLKARGLTNAEIAKHTGYTEPWVSQITRQPWFQTRLISILNECGKEPLKEWLGAQLEPSLIRLVQLRDQCESLPVALAATTNLLDRFLGKPVSRVEMDVRNTKTAEEKFTTIDDELKHLEDAERKLLTNSPEATSPGAEGGSVAGSSPLPAEAGAPTFFKTKDHLDLSAPEVVL